MSNILVTVDEQTLHITDSPKIAAQGVNENYLVLTFDPSWTGFGKTVLFFREDEEETIYESAVDASGKALVPHEVTDQDGKICFGICGAKDDIVYTTEILKYKIVKGLYTAGQETEPPTPGIYEQMLEIAGQTQASQATIITNQSTLSARMDALVAQYSGGYQETVLWTGKFGSDDTGDGGFNYFELSDDPSNYDYLDVYYAGDGIASVNPVEHKQIVTLSSADFISGFAITIPAINTGSIADPMPVSVQKLSFYHESGDNARRFRLNEADYWHWTGDASAGATQQWVETITSNRWYAGYVYKIVGRKLVADPEVVDLRVGTDGTTYNTAGAAVRGQLEALNSNKGILASGTDLNNVTTPGVYYLYPTSTYTHAPITDGPLEVYAMTVNANGNAQILQRITVRGEIYTRKGLKNVNIGNVSFGYWYKFTGEQV